MLAGLDVRKAVDGAPRLTVHALNKDGKHKVNTTKIYRKQSPDTGIKPETSDMPGKRGTFTPWTEHHAYLYMRLTKMNNLVNTTKINRKQSPDTGINPRPLTCRESVQPLHRGRSTTLNCTCA